MKKTFRIRLVQPAYNFFQSTQNESLLKSRISSFRRNCCKTLRNSTNGNFHNREALVEFHWYECRSSHTFVRIRRNVRVCKPHFYITDRSECKEKNSMKRTLPFSLDQQMCECLCERKSHCRAPGEKMMRSNEKERKRSSIAPLFRSVTA